MKQETGFAFHVHHDVLVEWCTDYDERVQYIKENKPASEQALRLRLFKFVPVDRLPPEPAKAWEAYNKAREACDKAWEAYNKAREACNKAREACNKAREAYDKAWEAYDKAWEACDKAWEACNKAWEACMPELIKLHEELCPNCTWDGKTIFPEKVVK